MTKPLNIGMVGCGFMGRAHSNAYHRVNQFFDVAYLPVLKALAESTEGLCALRVEALLTAKYTEAFMSRGEIFAA